MSPTSSRAAVLQSLLESDGIGIALLRASDWKHVLASATYEKLVGKAGTLGRRVPVGDLLDEPASAALDQRISDRAFAAVRALAPLDRELRASLR